MNEGKEYLSSNLTRGHLPANHGKFTMEPASNPQKLILHSNRSIIVVSDLHLGLSTDDHQSPTADFSVFLQFIQSLFLGGPIVPNHQVTVDEKSRKLLPPEKIILLGDIIDLWSPRDDSRASVLQDVYPLIHPLNKFLSTLDRELLSVRGNKNEDEVKFEIVYIAGNHDDEIAEFGGSYGPGLFHSTTPRSESPDREGPHDKNIVASTIFRNLTIANRHWPPDFMCKDRKKLYTGIQDDTCKDEEKLYTGIQVGNHSYFFMHGQQFDLLFNVAGVFKNYPGWVSKNYMLFRTHPEIKWFFRALFGLSLVYVVAKSLDLISTMFDWVMYFVFGLSLVIILFSIEPSTFRKFWDGISRRQKVKTESIQTIIDNGFWKEDLGKNILADTIVFGHTHVADDSKAKYLQKPHERRFINSGSWGDLGKENTFVYIDAEGPVLFSWPELPEGALLEWKEDMLPEQISSPTGDAKGIGIPISSITRWMRKNFWGRG